MNTFPVIQNRLFSVYFRWTLRETGSDLADSRKAAPKPFKRRWTRSKALPVQRVLI